MEDDAEDHEGRPFERVGEQGHEREEPRLARVADEPPRRPRHQQGVVQEQAADEDVEGDQGSAPDALADPGAVVVQLVDADATDIAVP